MPRKRTHAKRRIDAYSGAEAWSDVFQSGRALFDDFAIDTGVQPGAAGIVADADARAAWDAYGPPFLALNGRADCWALERFGEPTHAR